MLASVLGAHVEHVARRISSPTATPRPAQASPDALAAIAPMFSIEPPGPAPGSRTGSLQELVRAPPPSLRLDKVSFVETGRQVKPETVWRRVSEATARVGEVRGTSSRCGPCRDNTVLQTSGPRPARLKTGNTCRRPAHRQPPSASDNHIPGRCADLPHTCRTDLDLAPRHRAGQPPTPGMGTDAAASPNTTTVPGAWTGPQPPGRSHP